MTRSPFHPKNADDLVAPLQTFAPNRMPRDQGRNFPWAQTVRSLLALEIAHKLAHNLPGLVLKGGTALQARLDWPPLRASIDVDLEWKDPQEVVLALDNLAGEWSQSGCIVESGPDAAFSKVCHLRFPRTGTPATVVRVDISSPATSSRFSIPWDDPPPPWQGSPKLRVPVLEAQAAQKLLLAAPAPYGRNLEDHRGRQNLIKDLFDLHSLGKLDLDSTAILEIVDADIAIKNALMSGDWHPYRVIQGSINTWKRFAAPRDECITADQPLWRAYRRVRTTIRSPFAEGDVRIAAGCSHHIAQGLIEKDLDWVDAWMPMRSGRPRKNWTRAGSMVPVIEAADDYSDARGLLEAWAKRSPE